MSRELSLTLCTAPDADDGIVRLDPSDMKTLGVHLGDVVTLEGERTTHVRAYPSYMQDRNQRLVRVSALTQKNCDVLAGRSIKLVAGDLKPAFAEQVVLEVEDDLDRLHAIARLPQLGNVWHERLLIQGDWLRISTLDRFPMMTRVISTQPAGLVQVARSTSFQVKALLEQPELPLLGGVREVYRTCQGLIKARLRATGMPSARAVLLSGPAGCGKSSLVMRLAKEAGASFHVLDVNQLVDQAVTLGSSAFDVSLSDLARRGSTILLIDHLEALCAEESSGEVGLAVRAILAQICALLDELPTQPNVMVFGVTSKGLDPRLADHQRFDLSLALDAPHRLGRHEILVAATKGLLLEGDVDLARLAAMTEGATARDLQNLVLAASRLAKGMKVTRDDFDMSYRSMSFSAARDVRCDIPTTSWEDIGGLDEIKQLMCETLSWSLEHRGRFAQAGVKPPRSILLSGGQGTGKTSLVRALANFTPLHFIEVDCPLLAAKGEAVAAAYLHDHFALARRKAPCLVFFDDIDVLFEPLEGSEIAPHQHPVVAQLLHELDDLQITPGVVVMAATNRPDRLTTEVLSSGRFDYAVTLPMPDQAARKRILEIHARKLPLTTDVDFDRLADMTHGMSPADIANLCNRVGMMALRQALNSSEGEIVPPAVSAELFEQTLRGRKN